MSERTGIQASFERIPGMRCFACSSPAKNPAGLHMVFEETEQGARCEFRLGDHFQSYPGFAHGGIVSAVLDETMAYAGVLKLRIFPFTRKLEVQYRAGVPSGPALVAESWLEETGAGEFRTRGLIRLAAARRTFATATGEFVIPTLEMAGRMMPGSRWDGFEEFFRSAAQHPVPPCPHEKPVVSEPTL